MRGSWLGSLCGYGFRAVGGLLLGLYINAVLTVWSSGWRRKALRWVRGGFTIALRDTFCHEMVCALHTFASSCIILGDLALATVVTPIHQDGHLEWLGRSGSITGFFQVQMLSVGISDLVLVRTALEATRRCRVRRESLVCICHERGGLAIHAVCVLVLYAYLGIVTWPNFSESSSINIT